MLHSPRDNRPTNLRLTSTTSIALLDTFTTFYSARQRSTKGSSRGGLMECNGCSLTKGRATVSSRQRTREHVFISGEVLWIRERA